MSDEARPCTKEEVLHGVALLQAHLTGDENAVAAPQGDDGDKESASAKPPSPDSGATDMT